MFKKLTIMFGIILLVSTALYAKTDKIGLVINKDLYPLIKPSIDQYIAELKTIEQVDVVWVETSFGADRNKYKEVWDAVKAAYDTDAIDGVTFIGDLPIVDCGTCSYNPNPQCDLYYMDMDANAFSGSGPEFSSYSGSGPEIWMTRIMSSYFESPTGMSEDKIVNDYFARVSERMHGGLVDEDTSYCIMGQDNHWSGIDNEMSGAFYYTNEEQHLVNGSGCNATIWKNEMEEGHEYFFVFCHSNYNMHQMSGTASISTQYSADCKVIFGNMYACLNSRYDYANMVAAYALLGKGLNFTGCGKSGSIMPGHFDTYTEPMNDPDNLIGDAWKIWWQNDGQDCMSWTSAMVMEGVGTLQLRPYASGPYLTVAYPGGGEELEQGKTYEFKWGSNVNEKVKVELMQGGSVAKELAASMDNLGLLEVEITTDFEVGTDYKLKVTTLGTENLVAESKENFSIIGEYIIAEFPHVQDFDDMDPSLTRGLSEKWEQLDGDDFDWIVLNGPTPSSQYGSTGPTADHTSGTGNYVYVEASTPNSPEKTTKMISPKFKLNVLNNPTLVFWANMQSDSNTMGNLYVDIEVDGDLKEGVIHLKDDHGKEWFEVKQDLSQYKGERVRFIFRGTTGQTWCGDMGVDDFTVDGGTPIKSEIIKLPSSYNMHYFGSQLHFEVPKSISRKQVSVKLYNLQGKLIHTLAEGKLKAGYHVVNMSSLPISTGVYLCKMKAGDFNKTVKVPLAK